MSDHILYILMRNDIPSMNPGKAMAQANHAYGAVKKKVRSHVDMQKYFLAWMDQTPQEFGTTIVLSANEAEIGRILHQAERYYPGDMLYGWVHDPSYPLRDGDIIHRIPLDTCAFLFCTREEGDSVVGHLNLHP